MAGTTAIRYVNVEVVDAVLTVILAEGPGESLAGKSPHLSLTAEAASDLEPARALTFHLDVEDDAINDLHTALARALAPVGAV